MNQSVTLLFISHDLAVVDAARQSRWQSGVSGLVWRRFPGQALSTHRPVVRFIPFSFRPGKGVASSGPDRPCARTIAVSPATFGEFPSWEFCLLDMDRSPARLLTPAAQSSPGGTGKGRLPRSATATRWWSGSWTDWADPCRISWRRCIPSFGQARFLMEYPTGCSFVSPL